MRVRRLPRWLLWGGRKPVWPMARISWVFRGRPGGDSEVPCGSPGTWIVGSDQTVAVLRFSGSRGGVWCAIYVHLGGLRVSVLLGRGGRGVGLFFWGGIMARENLLWCCAPASGSHGFELPKQDADIATTSG